MFKETTGTSPPLHVPGALSGLCFLLAGWSRIDAGVLADVTAGEEEFRFQKRMTKPLFGTEG